MRHQPALADWKRGAMISEMESTSKEARGRGNLKVMMIENASLPKATGRKESTNQNHSDNAKAWRLDHSYHIPADSLHGCAQPTESGRNPKTLSKGVIEREKTVERCQTSAVCENECGSTEMISGAERPSSPLSSASEMLEMLTSLPQKLINIDRECVQETQVSTGLKPATHVQPNCPAVDPKRKPPDSFVSSLCPKKAKLLKIGTCIIPSEDLNNRAETKVNNSKLQIPFCHRGTQTRIPIAGKITQTEDLYTGYSFGTQRGVPTQATSTEALSSFSSETEKILYPRRLQTETTLPFCPTQPSASIPFLRVYLTPSQPEELTVGAATHMEAPQIKLAGGIRSESNKITGTTSEGPIGNISCVNVENLKDENAKLREEKAQLEQTLQEYKGKLLEFDTKVCTLLRREKELYVELEDKKGRLSWKRISESEALIKFYTGLPDACCFDWIHSICTKYPIVYQRNYRVTSMCTSDQLLCVLMYLKLSVRRQMLADWFQVSLVTIQNLQKTWINLFHRELFLQYFLNPTKRNQVAHYPPVDIESCSVHGFVQLERARPNFQFLNVKRILRGILGVSDSGVIFSVSKLYEEMSEKEIIDKSGILHSLNPGDQLLDHESIHATHSLSGTDAEDCDPLSSRSFKKGLSAVEKAFRKVKEYAIVERIPATTAEDATEIWQVCVALASLRKCASQQELADKSSSNEVVAVKNKKQKNQ